MSWGTPRIVSKANGGQNSSIRQLMITEETILSRQKLAGISALRSGHATGAPPDKSEVFVPDSVKNFRARIREEEKEEISALQVRND